MSAGLIGLLAGGAAGYLGMNMRRQNDEKMAADAAFIQQASQNPWMLQNDAFYKEAARIGGKDHANALRAVGQMMTAPIPGGASPQAPGAAPSAGFGAASPGGAPSPAPAPAGMRAPATGQAPMGGGPAPTAPTAGVGPGTGMALGMGGGSPQTAQLLTEMRDILNRMNDPSLNPYQKAQLQQEFNNRGQLYQQVSAGSLTPKDLLGASQRERGLDIAQQQATATEALAASSQEFNQNQALWQRDFAVSGRRDQQLQNFSAGMTSISNEVSKLSVDMSKLAGGVDKDTAKARLDMVNAQLSQWKQRMADAGISVPPALFRPFTVTNLPSQSARLLNWLQGGGPLGTSPSYTGSAAIGRDSGGGDEAALRKSLGLK